MSELPLAGGSDVALVAAASAAWVGISVAVGVLGTYLPVRLLARHRVDPHPPHRRRGRISTAGWGCTAGSGRLPEVNGLGPGRRQGKATLGGLAPGSPPCCGTPAGRVRPRGGGGLSRSVVPAVAASLAGGGDGARRHRLQRPVRADPGVTTGPGSSPCPHRAARSGPAPSHRSRCRGELSMRLLDVLLNDARPWHYLGALLFCVAVTLPLELFLGGPGVPPPQAPAGDDRRGRRAVRHPGLVRGRRRPLVVLARSHARGEGRRLPMEELLFFVVVPLCRAAHPWGGDQPPVAAGAGALLPSPVRGAGRSRRRPER